MTRTHFIPGTIAKDCSRRAALAWPRIPWCTWRQERNVPFGCSRRPRRAVTHRTRSLPARMAYSTAKPRDLGLCGRNSTTPNLAMDLAQQRYRLGLSSIVELSQAQLNQTQAQIEQASAKYDYQAQIANLNYQVAVLH